MRIPLPELGLDCEKKDIENVKEEYEEINNIGYNARTAENEKSVLVIDVMKLKQVIMKAYKLSSDWREYDGMAAEIAQNAKSFISIKQGE